MMISTKGRYALRVMIDIAENQHAGYERGDQNRRDGTDDNRLALGALPGRLRRDVHDGGPGDVLILLCRLSQYLSLIHI